MRIIHNVHFEPELVREYQHVIYQNLIKGMQVLVDAREIFNIPWTKPDRQYLAHEILNVPTKQDIDSSLFRKCAPLLRDLWQDKAIRDAYDRRREFQIVSFMYIFFLFRLVK